MECEEPVEGACRTTTVTGEDLTTGAFAFLWIVMVRISVRTIGFGTGWFVESLATQTLVIFVIRTRRVPFWRSKPSLPLLVTVSACAVVGAVLPYTPIAGTLGFVALPASFLLILAGMVATYLALAQAGTARFFRPKKGREPVSHTPSREHRRIHRVAARWTHPGPVGPPAHGTPPGGTWTPRSPGGTMRRRHRRREGVR
jgi:hypothetical protein